MYSSKKIDCFTNKENDNLLFSRTLPFYFSISGSQTQRYSTKTNHEINPLN